MLIRYRIVEAGSGEVLAEKVNGLLDSGFILIGGVQVVVICYMNESKGCEECNTTFYQAIALKTE